MAGEFRVQLLDASFSAVDEAASRSSDEGLFLGMESAHVVGSSHWTGSHFYAGVAASAHVVPPDAVLAVVAAVAAVAAARRKMPSVAQAQLFVSRGMPPA